MKLGNWIAIDKKLSKHFPDHEFSKIDAAYSLTLDYDNDNFATVSGYAKLWGWSRSKVRRFLEEMGVEISYPEDTLKKQKQKGQIKVQKRDRKETEKRQIRMVDTKASEEIKDRKETDQGQKEDRSKNTTNKPINNTKTKNTYSNEFELSWDVFPKRNGVKQGKKSASDLFEKLPKEEKRKVYRGSKNYYNYIELPSTEQSAMDMERFIRKNFYMDYQEKVSNTNINNDDGREKAQKQIEETKRMLNE